MEQSNAIFSRQKDFPWFVKQEVTLIGAGGIGSWVALFLTRINHKIILYEKDILENLNMAGQIYRRRDVGRRKDYALEQLLRELTDSSIYLQKLGEFTDDSFTTSITILALDNMETRKKAVLKWQESFDEWVTKGEFPILIDGRLEGEQGIIYTLLSKADADRWLGEYFGDEEGDEGACTMRATSYNGAMIAANMTAILNNHIANVQTSSDIRVIPYKVEYGFPGMVYDVIL